MDEFLAHYGKKGMRWGKRSAVPGVSRSTNREAKKDAKEFARAKMYYGTGAGTRRKLIRESVNAKQKRDEAYKKAFEAHLNGQDLSVHATKAIKQRKRTDRVEGTKKTGGAIARQVTGEMGTRAAVVAIAAGGFAFYKSPKGKAFASKTASSLKKAVNQQRINMGARHLRKYF